MHINDICFLIDSITKTWTGRIKIKVIAHMAYNIYIFHLSLSKEKV